MEINSRIFGKIEIDDNKIITIPNGLLGFEKYTRYVIAYDSDKESKNGIMWLQCVDEPELAFPVMDPMFIITDYRPVVEDEWLAQIGIFESDEELYVLSVLGRFSSVKEAEKIGIAQGTQLCKPFKLFEQYFTKLIMFTAEQKPRSVLIHKEICHLFTSFCDFNTIIAHTVMTVKYG